MRRNEIAYVPMTIVEGERDARCHVCDDPRGGATMSDDAPTRDDGDDATTATPSSTRSGVGRWMGLVETALDAREETADPDEEDTFELVERQLGRYYWFCQSIDAPRSIDVCERILEGAAPHPGAWERALVELSLLERTDAQLALERWTPPDDPSMEIFYRICRLEGERRRRGHGET
jgi:hypothetical protein